MVLHTDLTNWRTHTHTHTHNKIARANLQLWYRNAFLFYSSLDHSTLTNKLYFTINGKRTFTPPPTTTIIENSLSDNKCCLSWIRLSFRTDNIINIACIISHSRSKRYMCGVYMRYDETHLRETTIVDESIYIIKWSIRTKHTFDCVPGWLCVLTFESDFSNRIGILVRALSQPNRKNDIHTSCVCSLLPDMIDARCLLLPFSIACR